MFSAEAVNRSNKASAWSPWPVNCLTDRVNAVRRFLQDPVTRIIKRTISRSNRDSHIHRDKRRRHRHWRVTVYYADGEKFARVYIDRDRAARFAERQKTSPVVRSARITEVD